jgi:hypothetical protein
MRTIALDSSQQFATPQSSTFSVDSSSGFFNQAMEVYKIGKSLTDRQLENCKFLGL